jgi:phosphoribosyl 1,2-cyclic phosphate phosphodiesterase
MDTKTEITFLGTGTSIGVPVIGCDCEVCLSEDPKNKRLRSSIYVTTPEVSFIVDTGPDFRQQCLREGIRHLDAALFTHAHSDHVMGFDDLRRFTVMENEELPIYANGECLERLTAAFSYIFDGENRYRGYLKIGPHRISGPFPLGDLLVTPLPVLHGKVETNGFLFSRDGERLFAYIPDAKVLTDETKTLIAGIDLLILDGLQPVAHPTHLSISESIALVEDLKINRAWLTHFSCRVNYETLEPTLPPRVHLAWDGLKITL